jgi:hypothetical protein
MESRTAKALSKRADLQSTLSLSSSESRLVLSISVSLSSISSCVLKLSLYVVEVCIENGENQESGVSMKIRGVGRFSVPGVCFGSLERSLERFSGVGFGNSRLFHAHKNVSKASLSGALSALEIRLFNIATLFHPFSSRVSTRLEIEPLTCVPLRTPSRSRKILWGNLCNGDDRMQGIVGCVWSSLLVVDNYHRSTASWNCQPSWTPFVAERPYNPHHF